MTVVAEAAADEEAAAPVVSCAAAVVVMSGTSPLRGYQAPLSILQVEVCLGPSTVYLGFWGRGQI